MSLKIGVAILSLTTSLSAYGQVTETVEDKKAKFEQLLPKYNKSYESFVQEKGSWKEGIRLRGEEAQGLVAAYKEQSQLVDVTSERKANYELELEAQKANLSFLKQVEPFAIKQIAKLKQQVVDAGEFGNSSLVDETNLTDKNQSLQTEVDNRETSIATKKDEIEAIEKSDEYRALVRNKNRWVSRRTQKRNELATAESNLSNAQSSKASAESRLSSSESREAEAERRASSIRNSDIPREESRLRSLNWDLDRLERDLDNRRRERDRTKQERDNAIAQRDARIAEEAQIQTRLDNLKQRRENLKAKKQAAATPEEKQQIQGQIDQVTQRIENVRGRLQNKKQEVANARQNVQRKRRAFQNARQALQDTRQRVQNKRSEIASSEQEIQRLENLASRYDREAVDERSLQSRLRSEINQWASEISSLESSIVQINRQLRSIQSSINAANKAIKDYRQINIVPIQDAIAVLKDEIKALKKRQAFLVSQRDKIIREKGNVDGAASKIAEQEKTILEWQTRVTDITAELQAQTTDLGQKKTAANTSIQAFNGYLKVIQKIQDDFRTSEEEVLKIAEELSNQGEEQ